MQKEEVITVGTWAVQWLDECYNRWSVHTQKGYRMSDEDGCLRDIT